MKHPFFGLIFFVALCAGIARAQDAEAAAPAVERTSDPVKITVNGKEIDLSEFRKEDGSIDIVLPESKQTVIETGKAFDFESLEKQAVPEKLAARLARIGKKGFDPAAHTVRIIESTVRKPIVNDDPNCIILIRRGARIQNSIHSKGPIIAIENAVLWGKELKTDRFLVVGDVAWVSARRLVLEAEELYIATTARDADGVVEALGRPAVLFPNGNWETRVLKEEPIAIAARILGRPVPERVKPEEWLEEVELDDVLSIAQRDRLLEDHPEVESYRVLLATGTHYGALSADLTVDDRETLLVLDEGFGSHGKVFSAGPVVVMGLRRSVNAVYTQDKIICRGLGRNRDLSQKYFALDRPEKGGVYAIPGK